MTTTADPVPPPPPPLERAVLAQAWFQERLAGLKPKDFDGCIRICAVAPVLRPPPELKEVWLEFRVDWQPPLPPLSPEEVQSSQLVVIFGDPSDENQVHALCQLSRWFQGPQYNAPPFFWVPHTVAPRDRPFPQSEVAAQETMSRVSEAGVDSIMIGEPTGFDLALKLAAQRRCYSILVQALNDKMDERMVLARQKERRQAIVSYMLWEYPRMRRLCLLPPINHTLPAGRPSEIGGLAVGELIGQGMCGQVFELRPHPAWLPTEAVKMLSKRGVSKMSELLAFKRLMEVIAARNQAGMRHPNVLQIFEAYHSPSHLLLRMQYCGPENLHDRLKQHQRNQLPRVLTYRNFVGIIQQACAAVAHLHRRPYAVCHRDIKPKHFVVRDEAAEPSGLRLTLVDFDYAVVQDTVDNKIGFAGVLELPASGTVPFIAPEILLESEPCDLIAADVWSIGAVLLETICGLGTLEAALLLGGKSQLQAGVCGLRLNSKATRPHALCPFREYARRARQFFDSSDELLGLLEARGCRELHVNAADVALAGVLERSLATNPRTRWSAATIHGVVENLSLVETLPCVLSEDVARDPHQEHVGEPPRPPPFPRRVPGGVARRAFGPHPDENAAEERQLEHANLVAFGQASPSSASQADLALEWGGELVRPMEEVSREAAISDSDISIEGGRKPTSDWAPRRQA